MNDHILILLAILAEREAAGLFDYEEKKWHWLGKHGEPNYDEHNEGGDSLPEVRLVKGSRLLEEADRLFLEVEDRTSPEAVDRIYASIRRYLEGSEWPV